MSERVRIKGTEYVYEVADRPLGEDTTEVWRPGMPGGTYQFPDSILERIAPPLPPEPPVGAYVLDEVSDEPPRVYRRRGAMAAARSVWIRLTDGATYTWSELHDGRAEVTRLYREDEQPQEKYEPVKWGQLNLHRWVHPCGEIKGVPPGGEPPRLCHHCECDDLPWVQLYRRSSDG